MLRVASACKFLIKCRRLRVEATLDNTVMRFSLKMRIGLAWLGTLALTGCNPSTTATPGAKSDLPAHEVRIASAELRPMERTISVIGTLTAQEAATIAAQVAGQLDQNFVDLGDHVQAGQEIALIDTTTYEALANVAAANLARAQANAANAAQNLKRTQDLQREKIASASDLDSAVASAASTQAEVKAAEANAALARLNLDHSRVKAPFTGIIAERIASAGDFLSVGAPIARLVQTDPLRLRLGVPERDASQVRLGQIVRLSLAGDNQRYEGKLSRIAPSLRTDNSMLTVEADIPNPNGLRAGAFVEAEIIINDQENVVSVPADALITFAGLEKVVLLRDGKAVEQGVTTGRRAGRFVEVLSGLNAGESVVLNPAGLRTGQALIVVEGQPTPAALPVNAAR